MLTRAERARSAITGRSAEGTGVQKARESPVDQEGPWLIAQTGEATECGAKQSGAPVGRLMMRSLCEWTREEPEGLSSVLVGMGIHTARD